MKESSRGAVVDAYIVIGSAVVGLLVGMTGAGGGALMTPMLILAFSVKPSAAISSDLVAALVMRPVGAVVHFQRSTINLKLVAYLAAGSVPSALAGSYLLHLLGRTDGAAHNIETALGGALLVGATAMVVRLVLDRRDPSRRDATAGSLRTRPPVTVVIGVIGGLVVGATSVGAGSLMIVLLLFAYPTVGARELVGTDLAQAVPLTAAAALGALLFGHVEVPLTGSLVVGAVPGVLVGSWLSSRVPDRALRPVVLCVILASGLKYVDVGNMVLLAVVGVVAAGLVAEATFGRSGDGDPPSPAPVPAGRGAVSCPPVP